MHVLVDSMRRVETPKRKREVKIEVEWDAEPELGHPFWEHIDHSVTFPKRVILRRNLLGMFKELFIERGEWTSGRSTQI
jgi:hypothetical protein